MAGLLVACAPALEPSKQILGRWRSQDGLGAHFFADGKLEITYPANSRFRGERDPGHWKVVPGNKIQIAPAGENPTAFVCTVELLGRDHLLMKGADGASTSMKHVD